MRGEPYDILLQGQENSASKLRRGTHVVWPKHGGTRSATDCLKSTSCRRGSERPSLTRSRPGRYVRRAPFYLFLAGIVAGVRKYGHVPSRPVTDRVKEDLFGWIGP